mmetsp:Transcript_46511/g.133959  ORF Transcript_46511/g.133959 Transcript_46511/m.133959 type:complete len:251 (-) Transcript_46511:506-1258(-)
MGHIQGLRGGAPLRRAHVRPTPRLELRSAGNLPHRLVALASRARGLRRCSGRGDGRRCWRSDGPQSGCRHSVHLPLHRRPRQCRHPRHGAALRGRPVEARGARQPAVHAVDVRLRRGPQRGPAAALGDGRRWHVQLRGERGSDRRGVRRGPRRSAFDDAPKLAARGVPCAGRAGRPRLHGLRRGYRRGGRRPADRHHRARRPLRGRAARHPPALGCAGLGRLGRGGRGRGTRPSPRERLLRARHAVLRGP